MVDGSQFRPKRIIEVELSQPLPTIPAMDERVGSCYQQAFALVRLHQQPLGCIEMELSENGLSPSQYSDQIWNQLGPTILEHLRQDQLPVISQLDALGIPVTGKSACAQAEGKKAAGLPTVSVVIPTRNRPERVEKCLNALLAMDYPAFSIIVVDNAPSSNATAEVVDQKSADHAQIQYVREDRPGSSWARNRGLMQASTDIVAFVDDDVIVDRGWLREIVNGFRAGEHVACVTGLILPAELETPAQEWIERYGGFGKGFTQQIYDNAQHRPAHPLFPFSAGMFGSGANMAFRASALRAVGGFDPALGVGSPSGGGEELAAFFELITKGYQIVYQPGAMIYHLHHRDYERLAKTMFFYGSGLSAYLLRSLVKNPHWLLHLAAKVPYGLYFLFSRKSLKNSKKTQDYPKELTRKEQLGFFYGPIAYLHGLLLARKVMRKFGPLPVTPQALSTSVPWHQVPGH